MKSSISIAVLLAVAFALGWWGGAQSASTPDERLGEIDRKIVALADAIGAEIEERQPVELDLADSPVRGPADAPVVIVEFSDFECPYCLRAHPTVSQLLEEYPDDVRLVFKHFPLSFHKRAINAHRAVLAAGEQGKFWEMHDLIFENVKDLDLDSMMSHAATLGLDRAAFETAFHSDRAQRIIDRDMAQGKDAGVRGTPAFFINGRYLAGAQPFEVFKGVVEEALSADS